MGHKIFISYKYGDTSVKHLEIFDSSITIVLISPNMKELNKSEDEQWIPWEVSYSLRETTRNDRTSRRNGILAVVLPDINGGYDYMLEPKMCCQSGCTLWHTNKLFKVLRANMFNQIEKTYSNCNGIVSLIILAFGLMKLKRFKIKKTNTIFTLMFNIAE